MKKRNLILAAAATMLLSSTAFASTITLAGGGAKVVSTASIAANLKALASTANETGTLTATTASLAADGELLQVNDIVTITAVGAKFDRVALTASPVAFTTTGATAAAVGTWALDATDKILTGKITTASVNANATNAIITLTGKFDLTGVAAGVKPSFDMTVSRPPAIGGAATVVHSKATGVTTKQVFELTSVIEDMSAITSVDGVVKAVDTFKKIDGTLAHTVSAGKIAVATKPDSALSTAKGTILFKLSGLPVSTTKVTWTPGTGAFSQVIADGKTAPTTSTAGSDFWLDGAGNGYTLLNNTGTVATFDGSGTALVITVNGTAKIATTVVKLQADYQVGTTDKFTAHNILPATQIAALTRDGTSFTINRMAPQSTVRLSNLSLGSVLGKITVTAKDAAGTAITDTGLAATPVATAVASGNTVTISGATLQAAFPAASTYDFIVESDDVLVSHRQATTAGLTTTTYRSGNSGGL